MPFPSWSGQHPVPVELMRGEREGCGSGGVSIVSAQVRGAHGAVLALRGQCVHLSSHHSRRSSRARVANEGKGVGPLPDPLVRDSVSIQQRLNAFLRTEFLAAQLRVFGHVLPQPLPLGPPILDPGEHLGETGWDFMRVVPAADDADNRWAAVP